MQPRRKEQTVTLWQQRGGAVESALGVEPRSSVALAHVRLAETCVLPGLRSIRAETWLPFWSSHEKARGVNKAHAPLPGVYLPAAVFPLMSA